MNNDELKIPGDWLKLWDLPISPKIKVETWEEYSPHSTQDEQWCHWCATLFNLHMLQS